jgi:hypothetical protein
VSYPTLFGRVSYQGTPFHEAQVCLGPKFASSYYLFFLSGTSTPTNVYQLGAPATTFSPTGKVTSDAFGRFPAIYLDPSVIYRVQFFNSANVMQWQQDPYVSQLSTVGTSSLSAFGLKISGSGEMTVPAPNTGGSGVTMTLNAGVLGTTPLRVNGTVPGASAIIVNSSATTGAQTATFAATNKPGTATSSPAGWLPITCDGVQYYTPIWHGNPFTPYMSPPATAVIHIYTTPGSAVETIPAGRSTAQCEAYGSGGGGGRTATGGAGGLAYSSYSISALGGGGSTFNYTVGSGGAGSFNSGSAGTASSISAGTVTGFTTMSGGGGGGAGGPPGPTFAGAGGVASGGTSSNTTGGTGSPTGLTGFIAGDGSPYGAGGGAQANGQNGAVVFYYF